VFNAAMISIVSSKSASHHLKQLREWFVDEWGKIDPFEGAHDDYVVPPPLLLVDGPKLLGGLSFTSSSIPNTDNFGLWINTVLVSPEHRGSGLGSQLVKAAEVEATRIQAKELFVYSDAPELYRKLGWIIVDSQGESTVLKKVFAQNATDIIPR
jgi:GNAT superfamily N-acetyltransferase